MHVFVSHLQTLAQGSLYKISEQHIWCILKFAVITAQPWNVRLVLRTLVKKLWNISVRLKSVAHSELRCWRHWGLWLCWYLWTHSGIEKWFSFCLLRFQMHERWIILDFKYYLMEPLDDFGGLRCKTWEVMIEDDFGHRLVWMQQVPHCPVSHYIALKGNC